MHRALGVIGLLALLAPGGRVAAQEGPAAADPATAGEAVEGAGPLLTEGEIVDALRAIADDAVFARLADALALPEPMVPLFATHFRTLFASDAVTATFARRFAAEQEAFGAGSAADLAGIARQLGAGWTYELGAFGAARLPVAEQRRVLDLGLAALGHMGEALCAANARGALDPVETARAEFAYITTLPAAEAADLLALVRRAVLAEVTDDPPFVALTPEEERDAAETYERAVVAAIEAHPQRPLLVLAIESFDTAPDAAVCELTRTSLRAALGLEGDAADRVVRLLTAG